MTHDKKSAIKEFFYYIYVIFATLLTLYFLALKFICNRHGNEYTLKFENGASIFYGRIYYSDVQYGDYIKVKTKKGLFGMPVLINTDEIPLTAEEVKEYKAKKQQNTK